MKSRLLKNINIFGGQKTKFDVTSFNITRALGLNVLKFALFGTDLS